jgi:hypothetical protein
MPQGMLSVLAAAVADSSKAYSPSQLTQAAAAFSALDYYHEPALQSICKTSARSLKNWQKSEITSLLTTFEGLRFGDEEFMRKAVKQLTESPAVAAAAAAAAVKGQQDSRVSVEDAASCVTALVQLGYTGQGLQELLQSTLR